MKFEIWSDAADVVCIDFYLGDGLPVDSEGQAIGLVRACQEPTKRGGGGVNLMKFISNSKSVLETVPHEMQMSGPSWAGLGERKSPTRGDSGCRVKCRKWLLSVSEHIPRQQLIRHGMLSTINLLFVPLELVWLVSRDNGGKTKFAEPMPWTC